METAIRYIKEGDYYWNSGMFAFRTDTIVTEMKKYAPEITEMLGKSFEEMIVQSYRPRRMLSAL